MKVLKTMFVITAITVLAAAPGFAQATGGFGAGAAARHATSRHSAGAASCPRAEAPGAIS